MNNFYNPEHYKDPTAFMAMKPKQQAEEPAKTNEIKPKIRKTTPKSTVWTKVWENPNKHPMGA